ncbi:MAG: peptidoglycan DD-metalloendopeptidase family protein [bacterium]|nr:peptidoglycan DD-metalloendopeptidase family protein [bacterium]
MVKKPKKNRINLMLVPHGTGGGKGVSVHIVVLAVLILAGLTVLTGAGYIVFGYSKNILDITQLNRFERLSEKQKEKIEAMELGIGRLEESAEDISEMKSELESEHRLGDISPAGDLLEGTYQPLPDDPSIDDFKKVDVRLSSVSSNLDMVEKGLGNSDELDYVPTIAPSSGWIIRDYGKTVSSATGRVEMHRGVDFAASRGTPIVATADGVVSHQGLEEYFGLTVEINHANGYTTVYAHNMRNAVRDGESVRRGDVIAYMGSTGRTSTTHVHYEVQKDGIPINPRYYILDEPESALVDRE